MRNFVDIHMLNATVTATWTIVFDIIFILFAIVAFFFMHQKKKTIRLFIVNLGCFLVYLIIWFINYYTGHLALTMNLVQFGLFIVIFMNIIHYKQDIKIWMSKMSRSFERKRVSSIVSSEEDLMYAASEIVRACRNFSKKSVGALIVITPDDFDEQLVASGTQLNAKISAPLLESLFSTKGPLHDGAVLVKGDMIIAAGCLLPNSESSAISPDLGTRHRAAIGVTEALRVLSVVVSEENGVISIALGGRLKRYMTPEQLNEEILMVLRGDINIEEVN